MLSAFAAGTVFGETTGQGPARVLALHGWRRTHADWAAVLDGSVPAVALDLPGFGATPAPCEAWGSRRYAEALAPVLDEMDTDRPVVVVGHSFGGRVALHLATLRPDRVGALVLTGVPGLVRPDPRSVPRASRRYRLARTLHRWGVVSDARMEAAKRRRGSADYRAADGVMRDVLVTAVNETYEDQLRALACPLELVWGELDTAAPVAVARAGAALVPDGRATLTVLDGVDHFTPLHAPDQLRAAVDRRLADVTGRARS